MPSSDCSQNSGQNNGYFYICGRRKKKSINARFSLKANGCVVAVWGRGLPVADRVVRPWVWLTGWLGGWCAAADRPITHTLPVFSLIPHSHTPSFTSTLPPSLTHNSSTLFTLPHSHTRSITRFATSLCKYTFSSPRQKLF